jgi:hypothetical protein
VAKNTRVARCRRHRTARLAQHLAD